MTHDIEEGDYVLVTAKVSQVEGDIILVIPESRPEYPGGLPISPRDVLKNYGKTPCAPCKQEPKHIIAVDRSQDTTTILKMVGSDINKTLKTEIQDPYTIAKMIKNLVNVPEHTTVIIDNEGGRGEKVLESLTGMGANGWLMVFKPRPEKLQSLYRCMDLAVRTGELILPGFYNRYTDGDAEIIRPDDYLREHYKKNPMPKVPKKPCKDCDDKKK